MCAVRPKLNGTHEIRRDKQIVFLSILLILEFGIDNSNKFPVTKWKSFRLLAGRHSVGAHAMHNQQSFKLKDSEGNKERAQIVCRMSFWRYMVLGMRHATAQKMFIMFFPKTFPWEVWVLDALPPPQPQPEYISFSHFAFCFSSTFAIYLCPLLMAPVHTNSIIII